LKDLVGADLLAFLSSLWLNVFLIDLPKVWAEVEDYKLFQIYVKKMQCINVSEKALGMVNSVHTSSSAPKNFDGKTNVIPILYDFRQQIHQLG